MRKGKKVKKGRGRAKPQVTEKEDDGDATETDVDWRINGKWEQLHPVKVPSEKQIEAQAPGNESGSVGRQVIEYRAFLRKVERVRLAAARRTVYQAVMAGPRESLTALVSCSDYGIIDSVGWVGMGCVADVPDGPNHE
ncbi:unnamed protein product [Vitrella brassicaformis CCMP3155]|uniref:Uncharacterized protein n=1 Tax=Vitrella brassicaformis (strain CCMP3155) TaxID=1169540 RepID=A0A0G4EQ69_VITBC|nr:unnamed protein product [Vitrella brassicaformis CCMP3155]|eukprot:CEL99580.1 unnamed protein product [Vitrella brassicaformis CCMP3155]